MKNSWPMNGMILFCGVLLSSFTCIAQQNQMNTAEILRSDITFERQLVKNGAGDISHVKVKAIAAGRIIQEFTFENVGAIDANLEESFGAISEIDLDFDGDKDVDIYLGYMGGFPNNTQHKALLWDSERYCFVEASNYDDIGEPVVDDANQCIMTVLSNGPEQRVTSYYRWHGTCLRPILSYVWDIESEDYVDYSDLLAFPCYRFDAQLDGHIPVSIVFQCNDDDILAGYIYYKRVGNPILIIGKTFSIGDTQYYQLEEYQPDGVITGHISLECPVIGSEVVRYNAIGTWSDRKTEKEMQMKDLTFSHEMPEWFIQSLLTPEDPGQLGRYYSFQQWDPGSEEMVGGHLSLRAAGKNKVHFECCNILHNIAEGLSEKGRPAVLEGNVFKYLHLNECDYGFKATFFPRFVVLETITSIESCYCFGAGAKFDGIYIKTQQ